MSEEMVIAVTSLIWTVSLWGAYFVGLNSGSKDVDIAKLETERNMLKQRLIKFSKEEE